MLRSQVLLRCGYWFTNYKTIEQYFLFRVFDDAAYLRNDCHVDAQFILSGRVATSARNHFSIPWYSFA
jgi:hypothetical protein